MYKVAIIGPHGSGNRLTRRVVDACFDVQGYHKSYPIEDLGEPPALWRVNGEPFEADFYIITHRKMSPLCMLREGRPGADTVDGAHEQWARAYQQIYSVLGPFWRRSDCLVVRYRNYIDLGVESVVEQIKSSFGLDQTGTFTEKIIDGDLKYNEIQ